MTEERRDPFYFYGYSDDVVIAVMGDNTTDAGAYNHPAIGIMEAPDGSKVMIVGQYAPNHCSACWSFGLVQCEDKEGEPLDIPEWAKDVTFERNDDPDYSVRMTILAPPDTTFKWLEADE